MTPWFRKSVLATLSVVPSYITLRYFSDRHGTDPLVFMVWYFAGVALGVIVYCSRRRSSGELWPSSQQVVSMVALGALFGALAYGSLFEAVALAPNPGLPQVIYATASMIVFTLSALLSRALPDLFKPVAVDARRLGGIVLIIVGLYLLAGGRVSLSWMA